MVISAFLQILVCIMTEISRANHNPLQLVFRMCCQQNKIFLIVWWNFWKYLQIFYVSNTDTSLLYWRIPVHHTLVLYWSERSACKSLRVLFHSHRWGPELVCRHASKDPHRRKQKFIYNKFIQHNNETNSCQKALNNFQGRFLMITLN